MALFPLIPKDKSARVSWFNEPHGKVFLKQTHFQRLPNEFRNDKKVIPGNNSLPYELRENIFRGGEERRITYRQE